MLLRCFTILRALLLASVLVAPVAAQGRTLTVGSPAAQQMSAAVLDSAVGLYRDAAERGELVGAVLLVARHGAIVLHEAVGLRDRDATLPMERATMFRMASNTKAVVATGIAILVERGQLRYEDSVHKYIPSFGTDAARGITVHHLLTHYERLPDQHAVPPAADDEVRRASGCTQPAAGIGAVRHRRPRDTVAVLGPKLSRMGAVYYRRDSTTRQWVPGVPDNRPAAGQLGAITVRLRISGCS